MSLFSTTRKASRMKPCGLLSLRVELSSLPRRPGLRGRTRVSPSRERRLAHVAGDDPVVVALFRQIPVMGIGRAVAQEHGTLDIALYRTLVRSQREK